MYSLIEDIPSQYVQGLIRKKLESRNHKETRSLSLVYLDSIVEGMEPPKCSKVVKLPSSVAFSKSLPEESVGDLETAPDSERSLCDSLLESKANSRPGSFKTLSGKSRLSMLSRRQSV